MWRRIPVRKIVTRTALAVAAVQAGTLAALAVVDHRRKRNRRPAAFPRVAPHSVTAGGSEVTLYTYGEDLYYDMLSAIRHAKKRIFFETFIWKSDPIGQAFKDALIQAADRGVEVYVIYDVFANLVVPPSFYRFPDNIHVLRYPLFGGGAMFWHPRHSGRDHRKLVVVDEDVAYVGGYNIGSLYATDWRDTHSRLTGDIVTEMQNAFIDFWNLSGPRQPELEDPKTRTWVPNFRVHRNLPRHYVYPIRGMYLEAIDRAQHHVYLTHAYLVPDRDMRDALTKAVERGVDVRVIVPAESNHIVADWLSRGFYSHLFKGGVRLFLYQGAMVHAKTATIDGEWSTVGTANIDRLSLTGNYEINVEIFDADTARQMERIFDVDAGNCVELTLEHWQRRNPLMKVSEAILTPFRPFV
ncbi:MAG TPA: phosphatidylserine/phosphatidylglycerophosphate/cardiolipin synthase family protein [Candidatus Avipropionibacterium avicola]|uniref:Phosphatidylserine/phosphatidylglycerophosphate/ cardiolipin synthase family protein n=1 Tax=Candidatus Avipropionibacterium avicola TaxID=2840701 RepID=A0A9D1GVR2_9ACTN|nr:phosphatidylserine/phosphatidylglycerophosphate/cardiolipin synthase family protein [Candidatus Avipropionibacterium avicola]